MDQEYQKVESPLPEDGVKLDPRTPKGKWLSNLVQRSWSFLWGLCGNRKLPLVCDSTGRLRTSTSDWSWLLMHMLSDNAPNGSWTTVMADMGNTDKRVTVLGITGNLRMKFTQQGTTYEIDPVLGDVLTTYGQYSKVECLGRGAIVAFSTIIEERKT